MPTAFRFDGLRVAIYSNDHRPAHVHVLGADSEAVFNLQCPDGPPVLRENFGFRLAELRRIQSALAEALSTLCDKWSKIHGPH